jgi:sugar lactone lactonase YvrE
MIPKTSTIAILLALTLFAAVEVVGQNLLDGPESVAFDSLHNRYIVSNFSGRDITVYHPNGTQEPFYSSPWAPLGNCIDGNSFYFSRAGGVTELDLTTGLVVNQISIASFQLDGMTTDTSGYLYVVDMNPSRLIQVDRSSLTTTVFATDGLPGGAQAAVFDEVDNSLLVVGYHDNAPLVEVSLPGGEVSLLAMAPGGFDGVTIDNERNIYASHYTTAMVYGWDSDGSNFHVVSHGHVNGPSGLSYNRRDDVLAVPCFHSDRLDLLNFADTDDDDWPYFQDNCPETYNPGQEDADLDGAGDACDGCTDTDGDGFGDPGFAVNSCPEDNCPETPNAYQYDTDADGVGDECDNCLYRPNPDQLDGDEDGIGDACESCCVGQVGDANASGDDAPTIGDVTVMIDMLFINGTEVACVAEADVNVSGGLDPTPADVTIGDVTMLIDHLFITGASLILPDCP